MRKKILWHEIIAETCKSFYFDISKYNYKEYKELDDNAKFRSWLPTDYKALYDVAQLVYKQFYNTTKNYNGVNINLACNQMLWIISAIGDVLCTPNWDVDYIDKHFTTKLKRAVYSFQIEKNVKHYQDKAFLKAYNRVLVDFMKIDYYQKKPRFVYLYKQIVWNVAFVYFSYLRENVSQNFFNACSIDTLD